MRDDPYPARFYGRQIDEPFFSDIVPLTKHVTADTTAVTFPQPLPRLMLLLLTLYLCCALFLIFAVASYAAPLGSATIYPHDAASCLDLSIESATVAAR